MPAPRCIDCGYILTGLEAPRCPECGRSFDLKDPGSYTTKPLFNRYQFWLPAFLLALGMGVILYPVLIHFSGFGWAVALVLPLCIGTIIGFGCRVTRFNRILLVLIVLGSLLVGLYSLSVVGIFCGIILGAVALCPLMLGTLLGYALRTALKSSSWEQRAHLPMLLLLLAPIIFSVVEASISHPYADEAVTTTIVLPVSVDRAWNALMFYEEVHGRPPLLMRIALPHPLYTLGSTAHVGDRKVCVYSKGRLVKQITQRVPDSLLSFDVVEQTHIENRSVVLKSGSFRFVALGKDQSSVTLTTTYQPLLGPRWAWRWAEEIGVHTLHQYVLDGMRRKAMEDAVGPNRLALSGAM